MRAFCFAAFRFTTRSVAIRLTTRSPPSGAPTYAHNGGALLSTLSAEKIGAHPSASQGGGVRCRSGTMRSWGCCDGVIDARSMDIHFIGESDAASGTVARTGAADGQGVLAADGKVVGCAEGEGLDGACDEPEYAADGAGPLFEAVLTTQRLDLCDWSSSQASVKLSGCSLNDRVWVKRVGQTRTKGFAP
jgi:hypothetical protein